MKRQLSEVARNQHQALLAQRRERLRLVALALRDPALAPEVVREGARCIALWRARGLCSRDYIEAWERLLEDPERAADMLEEESLLADQMRQNSPFVDTVRRLLDD